MKCFTLFIRLRTEFWARFESFLLTVLFMLFAWPGQCLQMIFSDVYFRRLKIWGLKRIAVCDSKKHCDQLVFASDAVIPEYLSPVIAGHDSDVCNRFFIYIYIHTSNLLRDDSILSRGLTVPKLQIICFIWSIASLQNVSGNLLLAWCVHLQLHAYVTVIVLLIGTGEANRTNPKSLDILFEHTC